MEISIEGLPEVDTFQQERPEVILDWHGIEGDVDWRKCSAFVKRSVFNIFDVLKHLECTFDNRWGNVPERVKKYRGTNLASYHSQKENGAKVLVVTIDVGCHCSHDCCGHLCCLRYEISLTPDYFVIIRQMGFNY